MQHPMAMVKRTILLSVLLVFLIPVLNADDFFFESAGIKIHYTVDGKGEAVLLLHGIGGDIQTDWSAGGVIKELSNSYKVIAMDSRGHGRSGKPHDPGAYGMELVNDPIRLLDHLKIQKAHVVGYSMGGMIACAMVGYHPERLLSAVIGGAGWYPPEEDPLPAIRKQLADSLEQGKGIEPLIVSLNPIGAPQPTPEQMAFLNKMFLSRNDALALAALQRNFASPPPEALLRANKVPVLALIGEMDPRKSGVDRLDGLMPNLKIVVIPKANHLMALANPEFINSLRIFLGEHSAAATEAR